MIELTEKQRQAIRNGEAVRVASHEIGEDVVLLSATRFQSLQESLEDRREQQQVLRYSMKQAGTVATENPY
jgi:PHD/YefM family antitoxin component YafN of YafNO toxin-antitoxin module